MPATPPGAVLTPQPWKPTPPHARAIPTTIRVPRSPGDYAMMDTASNALGMLSASRIPRIRIASRIYVLNVKTTIIAMANMWTARWMCINAYRRAGIMDIAAPCPAQHVRAIGACLKPGRLRGDSRANDSLRRSEGLAPDKDVAAVDFS